VPEPDTGEVLDHCLIDESSTDFDEGQSVVSILKEVKGFHPYRQSGRIGEAEGRPDL